MLVRGMFHIQEMSAKASLINQLFYSWMQIPLNLINVKKNCYGLRLLEVTCN